MAEEGVRAEYLSSSPDVVAKESPGDSISSLAWSPVQAAWLWFVGQGFFLELNSHSIAISCHIYQGMFAIVESLLACCF